MIALEFRSDCERAARILPINQDHANRWFAARPSGTENVYKIYAESSNGESHLQRLLEEAQSIDNVLMPLEAAHILWQR